MIALRDLGFQALVTAGLRMYVSGAFVRNFPITHFCHLSLYVANLSSLNMILSEYLSEIFFSIFSAIFYPLEGPPMLFMNNEFHGLLLCIPLGLLPSSSRPFPCCSSPTFPGEKEGRAENCRLAGFGSGGLFLVIGHRARLLRSVAHSSLSRCSNGRTLVIELNQCRLS